MIDDVPSAKAVLMLEIQAARKFAETLPDGTYDITSGKLSSGYNTKVESEDWFYAVGGYSAWGKGKLAVCKGEYEIQFEYKFADMYNWDAGKKVTVFGITITDYFMGEFHRMGLAREFPMNGKVKKMVKWRKGDTTPTVTVPPPGGRDPDGYYY